MPEDCDQVGVALATVRRVLGDAVLAVYLHGSAVSDGLKPQSDIDILVIIDRPMTALAREVLLADLLSISARHPVAPGDLRCLEVMVFVAQDLTDQDISMRAEFVFGEWLRQDFDAGVVPLPVRDPGNTLILAQARQEARPLFGPDLADLLPEISVPRIRRAMGRAISPLVAGLRGDERNVLLTLARMWRTGARGEFVSKAAAADWAVRQMPEIEAQTLDLARKAYVGEVSDTWPDRWAAADRTARYLQARVMALL